MASRPGAVLAPVNMDADLDQGYCAAIEALQVSLRAALQLPEGSIHARTALRHAAADRELFFQAGFRLLESMADSPDCAKVYRGLLGYPAFLLELTRKERFSRSKLLQICRNFSAIDNRLDIHLARLLPGRFEDPYGLEPKAVTRILEVLDEISVGPRLILPLGHLVGHPDPQVAEKGTVLLGRRVRNAGWTRRRLESGGPDVRAGAVEGLWGRDNPEARITMRRCLLDANEHVVGNAVFGLHLLKEPDTPLLVEHMMEDERPGFRATAAWLTGQIGAPELAGLLQRAKNDCEARVRLAAKQAMVKIRHAKAAAPAQPETKPPERQEPPVRQKPVEPAVAEIAHRKARDRQLRVRLDGTTAATRWG